MDYGGDVYDGMVSVNSSLGGPLAGYAYDDLGRRTAVTRPNGVGTAYGYDPVSRLTAISHDLPGAGPDLTLGYAHNPAGQIVGRTVSNDAWLFDPPGQVADYANNGKNQLTGINGAPVTYDAAANLATGDGASYGYDGLNRLTTADPAGTGSATLQYDPLGRLMRTIDGANTRFFYDGLQAIGEVDATGTLLRRYVPGAALDETAVGWDGAVAWPLTDERGSVIGQTYADGTVSINRYDAYGVPGAGNVGRFQYTGQMWLPEAGLYHYKARAYAPGLGRFLQTDPIGYVAGANLYAYVGGDPVNWTDPLGLDVEDEDNCVYRTPTSTECADPIDVTGSRSCTNRSPNVTCVTNPTGPGGPGRTARPEIRNPIGRVRDLIADLVNAPGQSCTATGDNPPGGANFNAACAAHDACYATIGATKQQCDSQFRENLLAACAEQERGFFCRTLARNMSGILGSRIIPQSRTTYGDYAWNDAQARARQRLQR